MWLPPIYFPACGAPVDVFHAYLCGCGAPDIYLPCCGAPVDPQLLHSVDISGFVPSGSPLCGSGCPCVAAKYFLPTSRVMAAMDNFQDGGRGQRNHPCVHFLQKFSTFCSILPLVTSIESHVAAEAFDPFLRFHFHQR